jgi:predicted nucleotide-binding protein (sugar kinase/HSP70/actin superfamily)
MKLKEARNLAIKYCEENNCNYTYISHNNVEEFYLADKEDKHTVFFINKNGSLKPCRSTEYAVAFHKELKKRKKNRRKSYKRKMADAINRDLVNED